MKEYTNDKKRRISAVASYQYGQYVGGWVNSLMDDHNDEEAKENLKRDNVISNVVENTIYDLKNGESVNCQMLFDSGFDVDRDFVEKIVKDLYDFDKEYRAYIGMEVNNG